jgi:nucleoside-diphosphate-sugar epimerase
VRLARKAKEAGVPRFLFASSCSLYGAAANDDPLDEQAAFNPVTPYGKTKVMVEQDVAPLADANFCPIYLRCATAYGASPRLRLDIVVNDLVARAVTSGVILMMSDGTPWRPLVHVEDICRAYLALLDAPWDAVHNEAFNVGISGENYRISQVAEIVRNVVPNSRIDYAPNASGDARCYRVNFDKIAERVPRFKPQWNVERGARQLYDAYCQAGLTADDVTGPRFRRLGTLKNLQRGGEIDNSLRRKTAELVPS